MNRNLALARPDILQLQPYQHGAWDMTVERMHTNEMPWPPHNDISAWGLNHYPEPQPTQLVARFAALYGVASDQILVGRGSDEAIDLVVRAFCRGGTDSVIICPPTYGMYKVAAKIQGAGVIEVPMIGTDVFALDLPGILAAVKDTVKIVFLCSPNNPTGDSLAEKDMHTLCAELEGRALVVVDEAYIEFSQRDSFAGFLTKYSNLVVLRTLSKAHALAGARCGTVLADAQIIHLLSGIIAPYAVPSPVVDIVMQTLSAEDDLQQRIETVLLERAFLIEELRRLSLVVRVWPSDSNFVLIECRDAQVVLQAARSAGLIIRDQRSQSMLGESVRISVGTPEQNRRLIAAIDAAKDLVSQ